jgi:hypothetical protein
MKLESPALSVEQALREQRALMGTWHALMAERQELQQQVLDAVSERRFNRDALTVACDEAWPGRRGASERREP